MTFIGPFAGNDNSTPANAPAITASFDWFHNLATSGPSIAATPTFAPASGTSFSSTLSVSIADTTAGAAIYYTTDGSTPTTGSQLYSAPFTISASTTVKAIATASGFSQSAQGSASYTYSPVTSGAPVSDEFTGTSLNTAVWHVSAPVGGSVAVSNGELVLTVPAGSNHDAAVPALNAVQVIQPISNANFDVAVKIDSTLLAGRLWYGQGLMVEGDAKNYIRFEVTSGNSVGLFVSTITGGVQSPSLAAVAILLLSRPDLSAPGTRGQQLHGVLGQRWCELEPGWNVYRYAGGDGFGAVCVELQCHTQPGSGAHGFLRLVP